MRNSKGTFSETNLRISTIYDYTWRVEVVRHCARSCKWLIAWISTDRKTTEKKIKYQFAVRNKLTKEKLVLNMIFIMLILVGTMFLCPDLLRFFKIKAKIETSVLLGDWALIQNAVYF